MTAYKRVMPISGVSGVKVNFQTLLDDRISVINKYSGREVTPKEAGMKILHDHEALKCFLIIEGGKYVVSFETSGNFIERALIFDNESAFLSQFAY